MERRSPARVEGAEFVEKEEAENARDGVLFVAQCRRLVEQLAQ
jgi:hypothetical protein